MFFFSNRKRTKKCFCAEHGGDGDARETQHFRGFFSVFFFFLLRRINIIAIRNGGVKKKKALNNNNYYYYQHESGVFGRNDSATRFIVKPNRTMIIITLQRSDAINTNKKKNVHSSSALLTTTVRTYRIYAE